MTQTVSADSRDLVEELRGRGVADVSDSTLTRALYSSDASLYRVVPRAVVRPRHPDELLAILDASRATGVPVTMRGAGTSIAGNAVGPGIVVDTLKHLNHVLAIDPDARTATVQPGVVHADLQRAAAPHGLRFGPDPSTHTRCTIGGMIGNNACGSRALGYGRTVDNVSGLQVAFGTGEELSISGTPDSVGWFSTSSPGVAEGLSALVDEHLAHVRTSFGRFSRQVSGYSLEHLLPERGRRLDRFLVGSEGTLGLVLEATVDLVVEESQRLLVVLGYPSMAEAADAVPALLAAAGGRMVACEGLDARIVDLVRAKGNAVPALPRGAGWLFVEVTGEDAASVGARLVAESSAVDSRVVTDAAESAALWRIREDGAGLAARSLRTPAYSGWEDAAVPPEHLGAWLRDFDELLRDHGLDGVPYGHFGDGCVHVRIDFPFEAGGPQEGGNRVFRDFLTASALKLRDYGGSLSGEHGDGRARSELLPLMYDAESLRLFAAVKAVCDPENLLNPGNIVDPAPLDADLRPTRPRLPITPALQLVHDGGAFGNAVHRCTGVGKCVAPRTTGVMCPSYLATRDEKDSTRGRSRVLQEALDGSLVGGLADPAVGEALDLCLACKGCASDCPTGVDMATYKAEALHQKYATGRRPRSHYTLGRLPKWAALTAPVAPLANRMLRLAAGREARPGHRRDRPAPVDPGVRADDPAQGRRPGRGGARRVDLGGLLHRPLPAAVGPRRDPGARGRRADGARHRRGRLLRADLGDHRPARQGPLDHGAHRGHPRAVRRQRGAGRRPRAVLPGHPAQRRGRAHRGPAGRAGRRRRADLRRAPRPPRLDAARPHRRRGGRPAALPPVLDPGLVGRRGAAGAGRRDRDPGARLLRARGQLRHGEGALRGLGRGGRDLPAPRGARAPGRRGAGRRHVLPGAARRPRGRPRDAPRRAAGF